MPSPGSFVLFEDMLAGAEARSRRYLGAAGAVRCAHIGELGEFFGRIEAWRRGGLAVVLLLDYEFGELLNPATGPLAGARAGYAQALAFESVQAATTREVVVFIEPAPTE